MTRRAWPRRLLILVVALVLVGATLFLLGETFKKRDYLPHFLDNRNELVSVSETVHEELPGATVVHLVLEGDRGLWLEAHLKVPSGGSGPRGAFVILGGLRTGRRTIDYLGDTGDWLVLALDYPYHGSTDSMSRLRFLTVLPEARRAMLDTVPAGMLALDYLWQRPDLDRNRVVLAGGSFGALFSPALAAADERVSAVAIFFGAGDLDGLVDANLKLSGPAKPIASWAGSVLVSPMEPLKYVHRIAPRPIFMLNGTGDPTMPVPCSRALHVAAGEPKTISWLELDHVMLYEPEFHQRVLAEFIAWLEKIGFLSAEEARELRQ